MTEQSRVVWDAAKVADGMDATQRARPAAMAALTEMLSAYGVRVPQGRYLEIIAGNWVDQLLHVTYAALLEANAGLRTRAEFSQVVAADLAAYTQLTLRSAFHTTLSAQVVAIQEGKPWSHEPAFVGERVSIVNPGGGLRKRFASRLAGSRQPKVQLCHPYFKCSLGEWFGTMWRWRRWATWDDLDWTSAQTVDVDAKWRMRRHEEMVSATESLADVVRALLPLHVPAVLLEGFNEFRQGVLSRAPRRPVALYTANAMHGNMNFKLLAAEWAEQGTRLGCHQHGSGYGLDRKNVLEEYETAVADRFYSWGWRRSDRTVVPLAPAYPALRRKPQRGILLVCCSFPANFYRLNFHPMPGTLEPVERNTEALLAGLPASIPLRIRLQPANNGMRFVNLWRPIVPHADFDDPGTSIFRRFESSELVVHNYLGTGFLEAMAYDIPTIALYHEASYAYRSAAQPLIDELERVGILHRSGAEAARFIRGIADRVATWWNESGVREARARFVADQANLNGAWPFEWETELLQLAA